MKKIAIIEDNSDVRENVAEILELANYEVITAENGKVGVSLVKEEQPDLIICDVMMPELDGYGVLYYLGKSDETSSIPFIFLTAKAEMSDLRKGMNLGADDYLIKPFDEIELLEAIESRLNKSEKITQDRPQNIKHISSFMADAHELSDLVNLSQNSKIRSYSKKEIIYHEADYPNYVFFVESGKVKTFKMNDDGKEFVTGLFSEGEFFGYIPVLNETNYTESATAIENTEVLAIPKSDFIQLIYNNKEVSNQFIKMLSNNVEDKKNDLIDLAYNTVRKRVADGLLKMIEVHRIEHPDENTVAVSRDDLASIVGTSTESVIRTLSEFKYDGYVAIKASKITILEEEKLRTLKF